MNRVYIIDYTEQINIEKLNITNQYQSGFDVDFNRILDYLELTDNPKFIVIDDCLDADSINDFIKRTQELDRNRNRSQFVLIITYKTAQIKTLVSKITDIYTKCKSIIRIYHLTDKKEYGGYSIFDLYISSIIYTEQRCIDPCSFFNTRNTMSIIPKFGAINLKKMINNGLINSVITELKNTIYNQNNNFYDYSKLIDTYIKDKVIDKEFNEYNLKQIPYSLLSRILNEPYYEDSIQKLEQILNSWILDNRYSNVTSIQSEYKKIQSIVLNETEDNRLAVLPVIEEFLNNYIDSDNQKSKLNINKSKSKLRFSEFYNICKAYIDTSMDELGHEKYKNTMLQLIDYLKTQDDYKFAKALAEVHTGDSSISIELNNLVYDLLPNMYERYKQSNNISQIIKEVLIDSGPFLRKLFIEYVTDNLLADSLRVTGIDLDGVQNSKFQKLNIIYLHNDIPSDGLIINLKNTSLIINTNDTEKSNVIVVGFEGRVYTDDEFKNFIDSL